MCLLRRQAAGRKPWGHHAEVDNGDSIGIGTLYAWKSSTDTIANHGI